MKRLVLFSLAVVVLSAGSASALLQAPTSGTGVPIPGVFGEGNLGPSDRVDNVSFAGVASEVSIWAYNLGNGGGELEYRFYQDNNDGNIQMFFGGAYLTGDGSLSATLDPSVVGPAGEEVYKLTASVNWDISQMAYLYVEGIDYAGAGMNILLSDGGDNQHFEGSENLAEWGFGQPGTAAAGDFALEIVPEPATMILLGFGGLLIRRRK